MDRRWVLATGVVRLFSSSEFSETRILQEYKRRLSMRRVLLVLTIMVTVSAAGAQEIRTEIKSRPNARDSVSNSDAIPDFYAIKDELRSIIVVRLKHSTDLLAGLEKGVREEHIENGVILAGAGSVTSYHFHVVSNTTFPTSNIFVKNTDAPADLVSMNGYIVNGRVHAHVVFTNADKAFGGHLEPGTKVFTFAIVTVGVLSDSSNLSHVDDKDYR